MVDQKLRVLMVHRKGIFATEGGEQDQVHKTAKALEDIGLKVTLTDAIPANSSDYDIVHFFGLDASQSEEIIKAKGMPKIMTPVFWDRAQNFILDSEYEMWPRPEHKLFDTLLLKLSCMSGWRDLRVARICKSLAYSQRQLYGQFQNVIDLIDMFLPNSEAEAAAVSTFYVIEEYKYRVVPNAINIQELGAISDFAERSLPKDTPIVCCSGCIDRRKNQYSLIKALLDVDVPLVFMGGIRDRRHYQAIRRIAGRRKGTMFLGHLSPADLHSVYSASRVHALPSLFDTPGIANLEAVAHECVNVGTQIGGLREYLGDYSLYANPFSVEHIKQQVVKALELQKNKEGAELVKSKYTYAHVAEATRAAYIDVLDSKIH